MSITILGVIMKKIIMLLSLLILIGCEFKTRHIEYTYHMEEGIVEQVKYWKNTVIEYNVALKTMCPRTDHNYLTVIRSLQSNKEYSFNDEQTYNKFKNYKGHKVELKFKHMFIVHQNKTSISRNLMRINLDRVTVMED